MSVENAASSSVWLQSHLRSESKKIKWNHVSRLWNEYRCVTTNCNTRRTRPFTEPCESRVSDFRAQRAARLSDTIGPPCAPAHLLTHSPTRACTTLSRLLPISGGLVFLWLLAGTLFYKYDAKFRASQAFYFTVQSGFSIGFGVQGVMANDAADPDAARWYTVFHILIGSSLIVGALSLWGSIIVSASHSHQRELEQVS
jgi:hypothetical protein